MVSVSSAAALLRSAKKPVIVLGSQATLPPTPVDDVRRALEVRGGQRMVMVGWERDWHEGRGEGWRGGGRFTCKHR